jgi:hypothetical protein
MFFACLRWFASFCGETFQETFQEFRLAENFAEGSVLNSLRGEDQVFVAVNKMRVVSTGECNRFTLSLEVD